VDRSLLEAPQDRRIGHDLARRLQECLGEAEGILDRHQRLQVVQLLPFRRRRAGLLLHNLAQLPPGLLLSNGDGGPGPDHRRVPGEGLGDPVPVLDGLDKVVQGLDGIAPGRRPRRAQPVQQLHRAGRQQRRLVLERQQLRVGQRALEAVPNRLRKVLEVLRPPAVLEVRRGDPGRAQTAVQPAPARSVCQRRLLAGAAVPRFGPAEGAFTGFRGFHGVTLPVSLTSNRVRSNLPGPCAGATGKRGETVSVHFPPGIGEMNRHLFAFALSRPPPTQTPPSRDAQHAAGFFVARLQV
jgi:hypothetical protein